MRLLHVLPSLDPVGGGPMEAVLRSGLNCLRKGHEVEVLTLDDPAAPFLVDYPLRVHALGPSRGGYGYNPGFVPWLRQHAADYSAVIVNSLWQYHSFGSWRALHRGKTPYFVFTHGMLDPWFRHTYPAKHAKKWLYWPWADYRLLRDARAVLFTCEEERLRARQSFWLYKATEEVVAFGTQRPPPEADAQRAAFYAAFPELQGKRLLLFLSRIHEKKGCDLLIEAFAKVAAEDTRLQLVMAGPDPTGWLPALQARARELGVEDRITWPGMLSGDLKWGAFRACAAYLLPSHQENFGIAVAEALACGVPVLISDKVNIWREVAADGAGFIGSDTVDGTVQSLNAWLRLDAAGRSAMSARALQCFEQRFTDDAMADSLISTVERYRS